ncbi:MULTISPECIES: hypothetical protein [unclassified Stenotrophomonas]|uniref:hypothetical protein n=1 Tax=unclassified Stenotrophomonas TaxID=196198 RepID=UPI000D15322A|nr:MULTISPECIES: hypothetical protein [unclassified Stenotrophomonas]PTA71465.1 hypothetical protein C9412_13140 [Stenotrophomonas sp. Nf1]
MKLRMYVSVAMAVVGMNGFSAHAVDAPSALQLQDLKTFFQSEQIDYVTGQCLQRSPELGKQMQTASTQWRRDNADAAQRGSDAALKLYPQLGADIATQRSRVREQTATQLEAGLASNPRTSCQQALNGIRFNVPLEMQGPTLTSPALRADIFKQASTGAATLLDCTALQSIQTEVVSDAGSGAQRRIQERWTFKGCDKSVAASVHYAPDQGGTSLVVGFPATSGRN